MFFCFFLNKKLFFYAILKLIFLTFENFWF